MDTWTQALENCDDEDGNNADESIQVEDEESELDCGRVQATEYLTQDFSTRSEVKDMVAPDLRNSISCGECPVLARIVEDTLIEPPRDGYTAREGLKTPLFNLVGELVVDDMQQRNMDVLLMRNTEAFPKSDRFMDSLWREMAGGQSLITPMRWHIMRLMKRIEEEYPVIQMTQQQFLETTNQLRRPRPKWKLEYPMPLHLH